MNLTALETALDTTQYAVLNTPAIETDPAMLEALTLAQTATTILRHMNGIEFIHGPFKANIADFANKVTEQATESLANNNMDKPLSEQLLAVYNEAQHDLYGSDTSVVAHNEIPSIHNRIVALASDYHALDRANARAMQQHYISTIRGEAVAAYLADNIRSVTRPEINLDPTDSPVLRRAKAAAMLAVHYERNETEGVKETFSNSFMKVPDYLPLGTDYVVGFQAVAQDTLMAAATLLNADTDADLIASINGITHALPVMPDQLQGHSPRDFAQAYIRSADDLSNQLNTMLDPTNIRPMPYSFIDQKFTDQIRLLGRESDAPQAPLPTGPALTP